MAWPWSGRLVTIRSDPAYPSFARELHRTLRHLYDPGALRQSPLLELFDLGGRPDARSALQALLLEAIEGLKPSPSVPAQANAWRIYHVLNQRYAAQFGQQDIARNLAISLRQLRRLQVQALHTLADSLWASHDLQASIARRGAVTQPSAEGTAPAMPTRGQELERLKQSSPNERVDIARTVELVLDVIKPLAQGSGVAVECSIPPGVPLVAAQLTTARHALLNILSAAVSCAGHGAVAIKVEAAAGMVWLHICPTAGPTCSPRPLAAKYAEALHVAREMVELFGGALQWSGTTSGQEPFAAHLVLPAVEQVPVLVIDDNADALRLLEQYLVGSHYRFHGVEDPQQALATAEQVAPQVIVLDLMMPGLDGWEVLGRLREHPVTRQVPVIVCTVLPEEDLALALGAAALIRKPFSRADFLSALGRQLGQPCQGSG